MPPHMRLAITTGKFIVAAGILAVAGAWTDHAAAHSQGRAGIVPIVNEYGLLLGGSRGGAWVSWENVHGSLKGGETYRLFSLKGPRGVARGGKPRLSEASGSAYTVELAGHNRDESMPEVGLGGSWQPMPRKANSLSSAQPVYLAAVAEVLNQHGLARATPHINRIVRVDLSGKGQDAVVIEAASPGYTVNMDGDKRSRRQDAYSFVMVRTLSQGKVRSEVLNGEFGHKGADAPSQRYVLAGVLDLNGDGVMEIVVETAYYEGGGDEVYDVKSGRPKRVLQVEDGA